MDDYVIVGKNIRAFRERLGISQEALGSQTDILREEIAYFETGKRIPSLVKLAKIADYFGVQVQNLFEAEPVARQVSLAFAFRAGELDQQDVRAIHQFEKIVRNYLEMEGMGKDGEDY